MWGVSAFSSTQCGGGTIQIKLQTPLFCAPQKTDSPIPSLWEKTPKPRYTHT